MRRGDNWARWVLTLLLGIAGTATLVVGPIQGLVAGHSLAAALAGAGPASFAFAAIRTAHVACVLSGVTVMFRPSANAYFATCGSRRASPRNPLSLGRRTR